MRIRPLSQDKCARLIHRPASGPGSIVFWKLMQLGSYRNKARRAARNIVAIRGIRAFRDFLPGRKAIEECAKLPMCKNSQFSSSVISAISKVPETSFTNATFHPDASIFLNRKRLGLRPFRRRSPSTRNGTFYAKSATPYNLPSFSFFFHGGSPIVGAWRRNLLPCPPSWLLDSP